MKPLNIIKVGGAVVEDEASLSDLLRSFAQLAGSKVLVHGGGRAATQVAAEMGIESVMVQGRRITDANMLRVVTMVYGGLVNKNIVARLQAMGVNALGLTGADLGYMLSDKRPVVDVDYGFVGDVKHTDASILAQLIESGVVPVLAPLTHDGRGNLLNTNADTIAAEAAKALAQMFDVTLTYCFEKQGVLLDADDDSSVIALLNRDDFQRLVSQGTISGGMIPKITNAFCAIDSGVKRVVITHARHLEGGTTIVG